jgi:TDG/mug DNA glycosylase family protein
MPDGSEHVLTDILAPGLHVVVVGTAVGNVSAREGYYYSHGQNSFWRRLFLAGLTDVILRPKDELKLLEYGVGVTDLNKTVAQGHNRGLAYDHQGFLDRVLPLTPAWVVFNGAEHAKKHARFNGHRCDGFGVQEWKLGESRVFVAPGSSPQVRDARLCKDSAGARRAAIDYWLEMGQLVSASHLAAHIGVLGDVRVGETDRQ